MSLANDSGRLLIVDDEEDITSVLKTGLESHGFSVDTYNDPVVALSNFKPGLYEVAILDIRMPKMTGFELYRELKKTDSRLEVCFFTAFEIYRGEFEKMFPELHPMAFFRKPISITALAAQLDEILKRKTRPVSLEASEPARNQKALQV